MAIPDARRSCRRACLLPPPAPTAGKYRAGTLVRAPRARQGQQSFPCLYYYGDNDICQAWVMQKFIVGREAKHSSHPPDKRALDRNGEGRRIGVTRDERAQHCESEVKGVTCRFV